MKYIDEYRDPDQAQACARAICRTNTRPWTIMEVCGGQTHAIVRFGLETLLPSEISLLHGPGCPVCVTPVQQIDHAVSLSKRPGIILSSFGDMLRVRGSCENLLDAKAQGADVRIVYSPMDALSLAERYPSREVVFFAVGFETTAPANAMAVHQAKVRGVKNFSMIVSHVLVPPALVAILEGKDRKVDGFLAAGHVCTVMGLGAYRTLAEQYRVPIVATGFEPLDILQGVLMCVRQLEAGQYKAENQYDRSVRPEGNPGAQALIDQVFEVATQNWRGIGPIKESGLRLRSEYRAFDASLRFEPPPFLEGDLPETECISGQVLQGIQKPNACPAFMTRCTPEHPLGVPMVSSEGACAAYARYHGVPS